jgi:hypothetical protein
MVFAEWVLSFLGLSLSACIVYLEWPYIKTARKKTHCCGALKKECRALTLERDVLRKENAELKKTEAYR